MNKIVLLFGFWFLTGCQNINVFGGKDYLYQVVLQDGSKFYAKNKPLINNNRYLFKDVNNQSYDFAVDKVLSIKNVAVKR